MSNYLGIYLGGAFDWSTIDGSLNAKPGAPQFQGLLIGYNYRPPWKVAGVDYPVGIYSNCTVNTSTSVITETGVQSTHTNGQQISLRPASGGTLPSGVSLDTAYFVVNVSGNTYQVSATSGGSPITLGGQPNLVVALKVPVAATNCMPPGFSIASNGQVSANGASNSTNGNQAASGGVMTADAYDFSFSGGQYVVHDTFTGIINFNNCFWRSGTNLGQSIQSNNSSATINVSYCECDGNGQANPGTAAVNLKYNFYTMPKGTFQYCYIHHISTENIGPDSSFVYQYNAIYSVGWGSLLDHEEMWSGQSAPSNLSLQFNLWYQPVADGSGWPMTADSAIIFSQTNNRTASGQVYQNNTLIGLGASGHNGGGQGAAYNQGIYFDGSQNNTSPQILDNYFDSSGLWTLGKCINIGAATQLTPVISRNISMNTGNTINPGVTGPQ